MTTFVAVVESGGFSAAARKLDLSTSVLSRLLSELEAHLGARLLTRTTRVVKLTDVGQTYFDECRRLLAEIDLAERSASGAHAAPRGPLTITAPALFGKLYVMPLALAYLEHYPEVDLHCVFVDRVVNMVDEGIDVGVRLGELPDSSLQAVQVGRVRRVVCAAPRYLEKHGVPMHPDDLAAHATIVSVGASPSLTWRFGRAEDAVATPLRPRITTTTNDAAIAAALAGFGIVRMMSYQVVDAIGRGALQAVLTDFEPADLPIHIVHREGRHATRKVRAFVDHAVETLRADRRLQ